MKLIKYLLTVFIISFLITWGVSWVTNKGLLSSQVDFYGKMNAASDTGKKTNVLIVGSSRALVNVDTRILDSVTGLRSYNYGLNAVTIRTCFNIMKYALHYQNDVKFVLLNIDYNMFNVSKDPYKDAYYYPFEKNFQNFLMTDSTANWYIHKLNFLDISLYDDFAKYAAVDGWIRPGRTIDGVYKGFYPHQTLNDFSESPVNDLSKTEIPVNENDFSILNDIAGLCKKANVKLVFVIAPYFKKDFPGNYYTNYYSLLERIKQVAQQNDILFLDYASLPMASDKAYFYNGNHLNVKGAGIYSSIVADTIRKYIVSN
ncbi:MAG: hypothetical protein ABIO79_12690 [Ferruginibacter sp.]